MHFTRYTPMNNIKNVFFTAVYLFSSALLSAQTEVVKVVKLDEFVVSAGIDDFSVEEFVNQVKNDTTFYQAFLNLLYFPHEMTGAVAVFNKDESEKGTLQRRAVQHLSDDEKMNVEITFEKTNGNIKNRKGEWKYLTAEMYDEIFFPEGEQKANNVIDKREQELVGGSKIEKHKAQLKRMMFNPGAEIENVPFIGDKMAIFEDYMVPYYDYNIFMANREGKACIAFSCVVKEGMEKDVVIQDLTSYFDTDTKEVLAREYRLAHKTLVFDFDISMKVENKQLNGWLLPAKIWYSGYWNAVFMKREIITFELRNTSYQTEVGRYTAKP